MTLLEEIVTFLVTANTTAGNRIFPLNRDLNAQLPALTYRQIAGPRIRSHAGDSNLKYPTIQFTAWGTTYAQAKLLAKEIITALESYQGTMGTISINGSFIELEQDGRDPDVPEYFVVVDVVVWYKEQL